MPPGPKSYRQQYERMLRAYGRFKKVNDGFEHNQSTNEYEDDVYSFFQHCYHLKDWLANDPASGCTKAEVEAVVSGDPDLSLSADMCNGLKHFALDRPPRSGGDEPQFGARTFALVSGRTLTIKFSIQAGATARDGFDVASKAVAAWKGFLLSKGLAV